MRLAPRVTRAADASGIARSQFSVRAQSASFACNRTGKSVTPADSAERVGYIATDCAFVYMTPRGGQTEAKRRLNPYRERPP